MTSNQDATEETKALYPSIQDEHHQQQLQQQEGAPGQQQDKLSQPSSVVVTVPQKPQSFIGHTVLSCCATLAFCIPCGLIAFILAMIGHCVAANSPASARRLGKASISFSIISIVFGILCYIIFAVYYGEAFVKTMIELMQVCKYPFLHKCYRERSLNSTETDCKTLFTDSHYYNGHCYHN